MELSDFGVPSTYAIITFLAYSSQWLFLYLEPHPLSQGQLIRFNTLLVCLLICYTRSVIVDPGHIPPKTEKEMENSNGKQIQPRKWCRKCNAAKPPRAHHCRECKRLFLLHIVEPLTQNLTGGIDAYRKWITTAPGLKTASLIQPSPTSSASSSIPYSLCYISPPSFGPAAYISTKIVISPAT